MKVIKQWTNSREAIMRKDMCHDLHMKILALELKNIYTLSPAISHTGLPIYHSTIRCQICQKNMQNNFNPN
jgi:hypothetical protein